MPSPKRWCPISRDLNDDPEVWEFTEEFGDRALRIWIEVLACLDRTDNRWRLAGQWLASISRKVCQQPATIQRAIGWMIAKGWLIVEEQSADGSPTVLSARNFWKYHKRRETTGAISRPPQEPNRSPSRAPSYPNFPNITYKKKEKEGDGSEGGEVGKGRNEDFEHVSETVARCLENATQGL